MVKRSLVVGANSFIGYHLIDALLQRGDFVAAVYNQHTDRLRDDIENVSIHNLSQLKDDFESIFLLSGFAYVGPQDAATRKKIFDVNVGLVDLICSLFKNARIILCSTIMVYKPGEQTITERTCAEGLNEYGLSKLWAEKIVETRSSFANVRLAYVYGVGMKPTPMIASYIRQGLEQGIIKVWGTGSRQQSYLYVSDAVGYLIAAADSEFNGTFLATSNQSLSNRTIAEIVAIQTSAIIESEGADNSPSYYFNNEHTNKTLSFHARVAIEDGIRETIQWIKKQF